MVKSETELKRFTKQQLVQWLTRHDQRLPADEKLKPYYLERALKYYKLLQKENANEVNVPSRSRSKGRMPASPGRTKRKGASNTSLTPKKNSGRQPVVNRTKRRHSTMNEGSKSKTNRKVSRSPSRSRKKVHKIPKKKASEGKNSPGLQSAIRKKRERVRRQTADPLNLSQMADASPSSDHSDSDIDIKDIMAPGSDNGGGYNSDGDVPVDRHPVNPPVVQPRRFACDREPSKMTIHELQQWLYDHRIDFASHQRKAAYVDLVRQHSFPGPSDAKRQLSPQHKDKNSPRGKKPKSYQSPVRNNAPLPAGLRQSPLTPQEQRMMRSNARRQEGVVKGSNGLLSTPSLVKTGVKKINTPSKIAMRDEIRNILGDSDDEPLRPMGVTPGGPQDVLAEDLDQEVLNGLLTDLRQDHEEGSNPNSPRVRVFSTDKKPAAARRRMKSADDLKENSADSNGSFYDSVMAKMSSPKFSTSPNSIAKEAKRAFTTNKKRKKMSTSSFRANRTVPSPASPEIDHQLAMNNGNEKRPSSPLDTYQQKLRMENVGINPPKPPQDTNQTSFYEDEPMSPAIQQGLRRSPRLEGRKRVQQISSAPKVVEQPAAYPDPKPVAVANTMVPGSPGIEPSSLMGRALNANKKLSPHRLPFEDKVPAPSKPTGGSRICSMIKLVVLSAIVAGGAYAFHEFDGLTRTTEVLDAMVTVIGSYGAEQKIMFCDVGSLDIAGNDGASMPYDGECVPCPDNAAFCSKGVAVCNKNYVLRDGRKCVLDGVLIQFGYDIRDQANRILAERRGAVECGELEHVDGFRMHRNELLSRCDILDESKLEEAFRYFDEKILPDASTMKKEQGLYFSTKPLKSSLCVAKEWAMDNVLGLVATFCVFCMVFAIWRRWRGKQQQDVAVQQNVSAIYQVLEDCQRFSKPFVPVDVVKQRIECRDEAVWKRVNAYVCQDANIRKSVKFMDGTHKNCWQLNRSNQSRSGFDGNSSQWSPGGVVRDDDQKWKFGNDLTGKQQAERGQGGSTRFPAYSGAKRNMWQ